jgi:hypothetical protein
MPLMAALSGLPRGQTQTSAGRFGMSGLPPILLQKSKVASVRIFGETLQREAIDDSHNLGRVTEVAYEFSVRR